MLFAFGANAYLFLYQPPKADLELYVVGKQWMWKVQHPGGQREIDALHIPVDQTVRIVWPPRTSFTASTSRRFA